MARLVLTAEQVETARAIYADVKDVVPASSLEAN